MDALWTSTDTGIDRQVESQRGAISGRKTGTDTGKDMKTIPFFIIFAFLTGCCKDRDKHLGTAKESPTMEEPLPWSYENTCAEYGKPVNEVFFSMADSISEYRTGLLSFFPVDPFIKIRGTTWKTDSVSNLTAWYVQKKKSWEFVNCFVWTDWTDNIDSGKKSQTPKWTKIKPDKSLDFQTYFGLNSEPLPASAADKKYMIDRDSYNLKMNEKLHWNNQKDPDTDLEIRFYITGIWYPTRIYRLQYRKNTGWKGEIAKIAAMSEKVISMKKFTPYKGWRGFEEALVISDILNIDMSKNEIYFLDDISISVLIFTPDFIKDMDFSFYFGLTSCYPDVEGVADMDTIMHALLNPAIYRTFYQLSDD
jgi:hypothetical protein